MKRYAYPFAICDDDTLVGFLMPGYDKLRPAKPKLNFTMPVCGYNITDTSGKEPVKPGEALEKKGNTKMSKKIITILALVLVLVTAAVVLSSCGKKAEEETAEMTIRFVNAAGTDIKQITLKDRIGSEKQAWTAGSLTDGNEISMTIKPAVKNGAPEVDFSFTSSGIQRQTLIVEKGDKTITFKPDADGNIIAEIESK
jgi:hypothetical protein